MEQFVSFLTLEKSRKESRGNQGSRNFDQQVQKEKEEKFQTICLGLERANLRGILEID